MRKQKQITLEISEGEIMRVVESMAETIRYTTASGDPVWLRNWIKRMWELAQHLPEKE